MNHPQLWRSSSLALTLLLAAFAPGAASGAEGHTVRKGETFTAIARRYHISVSRLQKANPRVNPGIIRHGQVLNLPAGARAAGTGAAVSSRKAATGKDTEEVSTRRKEKASIPAKSGSTMGYRVKSGETLSGLARRSGVSVGELAEMNHLSSLQLMAGQKLILPAKAGSGAGSGSLPGAPRGTASARPGRENPSPAPVPSRGSLSRGGDRDFEVDKDSVDLTPPPRARRGSPIPVRKPAPNPPATQGTYYHVVKRGDTFSSIARERGVSVAALTKANRGVDSARLTVNQKINVPGVQLASSQFPQQLAGLESPATSGRRADTTSSSRTRAAAGPAGGEDPAAGTVAETAHDQLPPGPSGVENAGSVSAPASLSRPADPLSRPDPGTLAYRIAPQDSMDSIAREFNTTARELRALNRMGTFDQIHVGNYLKVPWDGGATPSAAVTSSGESSSGRH